MKRFPRGLLVFGLALVLALSSFDARAAKIVQPGASTPTGAAGGDLGGTYPNPTVTSGAHLAVGSVPFQAVGTLTIIGTPTSGGTGGGGTSFSLNTVAGTQPTDNLFICASAGTTPSTNISCPAGWNTVAQAGQFVNQKTQATLCSCSAGTCTNASYSVSWTTGAFSAGYEYAIRGLTSLTPDATYAGASTLLGVNVVTPTTGTFVFNDWNIGCGGGIGTNLVSLMTPALVNGGAQTEFGIQFGVVGGTLYTNNGNATAIAGALYH